MREKKVFVLLCFLFVICVSNTHKRIPNSFTTHLALQKSNNKPTSTYINSSSHYSHHFNKVTSCQVTSLKVTSDLTLDASSDLTLDAICDYDLRTRKYISSSDSLILN